MLGRNCGQVNEDWGGGNEVLVLMHATAAEFRLGGVEENAIALGVDEGINGVLRGRARNELAVPARENDQQSQHNQ